jgi:hypothetical protein
MTPDVADRTRREMTDLLHETFDAVAAVLHVPPDALDYWDLIDDMATDLVEELDMCLSANAVMVDCTYPIGAES